MARLPRRWDHPNATLLWISRTSHLVPVSFMATLNSKTHQTLRMYRGSFQGLIIARMWDTPATLTPKASLNSVKEMTSPAAWASLTRCWFMHRQHILCFPVSERNMECCMLTHRRPHRKNKSSTRRLSKSCRFWAQHIRTAVF